MSKQSVNILADVRAVYILMNAFQNSKHLKWTIWHGQHEFIFIHSVWTSYRTALSNARQHGEILMITYDCPHFQLLGVLLCLAVWCKVSPSSEYSSVEPAAAETTRPTECLQEGEQSTQPSFSSCHSRAKLTRWELYVTLGLGLIVKAGNLSVSLTWNPQLRADL